jgi:hypothetical protein
MNEEEEGGSQAYDSKAIEEKKKAATGSKWPNRPIELKDYISISH